MINIKHRAIRYFTAIVYAYTSTFQWVISLSTISQLIFILSNIVLRIYCLLLSPFVRRMLKSIAISVDYWLNKILPIRSKQDKNEADGSAETMKGSKSFATMSEDSFMHIKQRPAFNQKPSYLVSDITARVFVDEDSEPESPVTPHLGSQTGRYYSLFNTGFDLGLTSYDTVLYSPRGKSDQADSTDDVEMIHELSVLNFLNQVDTEDIAYFSRHLDTNYS